MKHPIPLFTIGTVVYLNIPTASMTGRITGYIVREGGVITYLVRWSEGTEDEHRSGELTTEKKFDTTETDFA